MPVDAGVARVGVGAIVASTSDLFYTIYVVQSGRAGFYLPGSVMRIPLGGGEPAQVASGYLFGQPLLTATSVLFLASNTLPNHASDAIISIPLSGGPPTPVVTLASGDSFLNGIATDGTFVYFSDQQGLQAVPLAAGSGSPAPVTIVPGALTDGIGVFGQQLIFTLSEGGVESIPLPARANSPMTTLGTTGTAPVDLSSCGSNACWLDEGNNALEEIDPRGGKITTIATLTGPLANAFTFVFDGTDFYVTGTDAAQRIQSLARVPGDGGCPVVIASMPPSDSMAVAVDDECVYWSSSNGIFSLAKSADGPFNQ